MAAKTNELISMVESLPVDIKTTLVEKILNSLYPSQKEIDALWSKVAERRVDEIKTGKVKQYPAIRYSGKFRKNFIDEIFFPPRSKGRAA